MQHGGYRRVEGTGGGNVVCVEEKGCGWRRRRGVGGGGGVGWGSAVVAHVM